VLGIIQRQQSGNASAIGTSGELSKRNPKI
jgi:hypothetical protein